MTREDNTMTDITERARLLEAAVQGVAWALINDDTDTSDRGVSEEHYAERVADARRMLPDLIEREPVVVDDAMRARIWREGWTAGWFSRHRAHPDSDGNFGISKPVVNPYEPATECICPLRGCEAHRDNGEAPGEEWTEYRSAVVYVDERGDVQDVRETAQTRRSFEAAMDDARNELPDLDRDDDEPPIARAIVSRLRRDPGDWSVRLLTPDGQETGR